MAQKTIKKMTVLTTQPIMLNAIKERHLRFIHDMAVDAVRSSAGRGIQRKASPSLHKLPNNHLPGQFWMYDY